MDDPSDILVLAMQIEDNEQLLYNLNETNDLHAALTLQNQELRQQLQFLRDSSLVSQLGDSPPTPPHNREESVFIVRTNHEKEDKQAGQPRLQRKDAALVNSTTADVITIEALPLQNASVTNLGAELDGPMHEIDATENFDETLSESESAESTTPLSSIHEGEGDSSCIACVTSLPNDLLIICPCDHTYCAPCLTEHFKSGIQGPGFPPACCSQPIPLDLVRPHLTHQLLTRFNEKQAIIDNPAAIYCALLSCQTLLLPENFVNGTITCACSTVTCVACRFIAHEGACSDSTERTALLQLTISEGLRACYRCGELYDRVEGCNHMW
jgi:hypothetical protein